MRLWQYKAVTQPILPPGPVAESITCDKWLGQNQPPQSNWRDAATKAATVALLATTVMTNLTPVGNLETIKPDKWLPQIPAQIADIKRLQHLYPSVFADTGLALNTSVPLYEAATYQTNQPRFDLKRLQHLAPNSFWSPTPLTTAELVTVDKWVPPTAQPLFDLKRQQYLAPTSFFVDTAPFTPFVQSSDTTSLVFPKQTQYQSQAFTRLVVASAEAITPDKWLGQYPNTIADIKRLQHLAPSVFADTGQVLNTSVPFYDTATYQTNQPLFDLKRQQYLAPSSFADTGLVLNTSVPLYEAATYQTTVPYLDLKRLQYLAPSTFWSTTTPAPAELVTADKWLPPTNQPRFDLKRQQSTYPTNFLVDIAPLSPFVQSSDTTSLVFPKQTQYQSQTIVPFFAASTETITPDKWLAPTAQPQFDRKRLQYLSPTSFFVDIAPQSPIVITTQSVVISAIHQVQYQSQTIVPFFAAPIETITADKWLPQLPPWSDPVKRLQYLSPSSFDNLSQVLNTSVPFYAAAALPQTSVPYFDRPRLQHLYPTSFTDPFHLLDKETITPDKWLGQYPNAIADIKRQQYLQPAHFLTPPQISVATIAQQIAAITQTGVPYFDRPRRQWSYPTSFHTDIASVRIPCPPIPSLILVDGDPAYRLGGTYYLKL